MKRRAFLRRPSPAMVVACIALGFGLSGTGYAVSGQLRLRSVGNEHLKAEAVDSRVLRNFSIRAVDIVPGVFRRGARGLRGRTGPAGAPGPAGPAGPAGAAGPTGPAGLVSGVAVRQASVNVPGSASDSPTPNTLWVTRTVSVNCASGEKAISAGTGWSADVNDLELVTVWIKPTLQPDGVVTGYTAKGGNNARDGDDHTFTLYVLCYK